MLETTEASSLNPGALVCSAVVTTVDKNSFVLTTAEQLCKHPSFPGKAGGNVAITTVPSRSYSEGRTRNDGPLSATDPSVHRSASTSYGNSSTRSSTNGRGETYPRQSVRMPAELCTANPFSLKALCLYHTEVLPELWATEGCPLSSSNKILSNIPSRELSFSLKDRSNTAGRNSDALTALKSSYPPHCYEDVIHCVQENPNLYHHMFKIGANSPYSIPHKNDTPFKNTESDGILTTAKISGRFLEDKSMIREIKDNHEVVRQELLNVYFVATSRRMQNASNYVQSKIQDYKNGRIQADCWDRRAGSLWLTTGNDSALDQSQLLECLNPTLGDASICNPESKLQEDTRVYAAFYSRRITYACPAAFITDRRRVQSRRDAEVVRIKKYLLRKVINRIQRRWIPWSLLKRQDGNAYPVEDRNSHNQLCCPLLSPRNMSQELLKIEKTLASSNSPSDFHYHEVDYDIQFADDMVSLRFSDADGYNESLTDGSSAKAKSSSIAASYSDKPLHQAVAHSQSEEINFSGSRPSRNLPPSAVAVLKEWMFDPKNTHHPYPSENEKERLQKKANINRKQLNNWFINARKRIWQKGLQSSSRKDVSTEQNSLQMPKSGKSKRTFTEGTCMPSFSVSEYPPARAATRNIPVLGPLESAPQLPINDGAMNTDASGHASGDYNDWGVSDSTRRYRINRARQMAAAILDSGSSDTPSSNRSEGISLSESVDNPSVQKKRSRLSRSPGRNSTDYDGESNKRRK